MESSSLFSQAQSADRIQMCLNNGTPSKWVFLTSVPPVVTCGPGQGALEGVEQIEEGPGQHHNVVDVQIEHNN